MTDMFNFFDKRERDQRPSPSPLEQIEAALPHNPFVEQANQSDNIESGAVTDADLNRVNFPQEQPVSLPESSVSSPVLSVVVGSSAVILLFANPNRKELFIVNRGTSIIYIGLGSNPTSTQYHLALPACSSADDGTGGVFISDIWQGDVYGICGAALSSNACVTELT